MCIGGEASTSTFAEEFLVREAGLGGLQVRRRGRMSRLGMEGPGVLGRRAEKQWAGAESLG